MTSPLRQLHDIDWDFPESDATDGIHSIHPYPAKFIPEIPRTLIQTIGVPSNTWVLDPFCGSGVTLVEAQRAGIPSIGIDLNPIACLISQVKTLPLSDHMATEGINVVMSARSNGREVAVPRIPNLDHWFKPDIQQVVARLLHEIGCLSNDSTQQALRLALSSILVRVSNQDSDTRYAAVPKGLDAEKLYSLFLASTQRIAEVKRSYHPKTLDVRVVCDDILNVKPESIEQPVGLVVTSPPYPNAYEYWLYHKYRMYWLGYDPLKVKQREIGARAHYFKKNHPTDQDFVRQMSQVLNLLRNVLVAGGHICVVIGHSKIHGRIVDNSAIITEVAEKAGFAMLEKLTRRIANHRKSFNLSHANIQSEDILIFRKE